MIFRFTIVDLEFHSLKSVLVEAIDKTVYVFRNAQAGYVSMKQNQNLLR